MKKSAAILLASVLALSIVQLSVAEEDGSDIRAHLLKLKQTLQDNCDAIPQVEVNEDYESIGFSTTDMSKCVMEVDGKKYCAFKFRTPKKFGHMVWSFREMKGMKCYCICGKDCPMLGFVCKKTELKDNVETVGKEGETFVMQRLSSAEIKPDTEYMIWFNIEEGAETELTHSMNCFEGDDIREYEEVFTMLY